MIYRTAIHTFYIYICFSLHKVQTTAVFLCCLFTMHLSYVRRWKMFSLIEGGGETQRNPICMFTTTNSISQIPLTKHIVTYTHYPRGSASTITLTFNAQFWERARKLSSRMRSAAALMLQLSLSLFVERRDAKHLQALIASHTKTYILSLCIISIAWRHHRNMFIMCVLVCVCV